LFPGFRALFNVVLKGFQPQNSFCDKEWFTSTCFKQGNKSQLCVTPTDIWSESLRWSVWWLQKLKARCPNSKFASRCVDSVFLPSDQSQLHGNLTQTGETKLGCAQVVKMQPLKQIWWFYSAVWWWKLCPRIYKNNHWAAFPRHSNLSASGLDTRRFQKWGCVAGPFLVPHFCEQFGLIMTSATRTKRKKCDPQKLKLFKNLATLD
jgi:hypothetical protein